MCNHCHGRSAFAVFPLITGAPIDGILSHNSWGKRNIRLRLPQNYLLALFHRLLAPATAVPTLAFAGVFPWPLGPVPSFLGILLSPFGLGLSQKISLASHSKSLRRLFPDVCDLPGMPKCPIILKDRLHSTVTLVRKEIKRGSHCHPHLFIQGILFGDVFLNRIGIEPVNAGHGMQVEKAPLSATCSNIAPSRNPGLHEDHHRCESRYVVYLDLF